MTPAEIREARLALGLTQKQFGTLLHSTERAARAWESGYRNMPGATEELLKIKLEEILEG
jgi:DNA-binding transcriptional regulator YiaG